MKNHRTGIIRIAAVLLLTVFMFSLNTACASTGNESTNKSEPSTAITESTKEEQSTTTELETTEEGGQDSISFTDMTGRELTLDRAAEKIVVLTAADCEILFALNMGEKVVGRGEYCDYPEAVLDVPAVQSGSETNLEQVISLNPDVIFMGTMDQDPEQIEAFEKAGILVVVTSANDIEGVYEAIDLIGKATAKNEEASKLVSQMKADFEALADQAKEEATEDKSIYFEVSPLEWGLWAAGNNTFMQEITDLLGLKNIFDDVDGWGEVSQEQVIERSPDYIVTITMYNEEDEGPTPIDEILGRDGWANITAVKENQIFLADSDQLSRPGPRLVEGAKALYDYIYGA